MEYSRAFIQLIHLVLHSTSTSHCLEAGPEVGPVSRDSCAVLEARFFFRGGGVVVVRQTATTAGQRQDSNYEDNIDCGRIVAQRWSALIYAASEMRQPARSIWESASRPLFVRSVWLERIGEAGRSHRRHFILDYEPRQRQRRQSARRADLCHYEGQLCELHGKSEDCDYPLDEYLLLDATKLTLQQQQQQQQHMANKMQAAFSAMQSKRQARRRTWLLGRGKGYQFEQFMEHNSRRSSLQDAAAPGATAAAGTHTNNPEERLAERVINWLDLAGRADIVKATTAVNSSAPVHPKCQRICRQTPRSNGLRREAGAQRGTPRKSVSKQQPPQQAATNCCPASSTSNAKPITIIFNKEGVPVRLNRPPRNIDLCELSNSASVARRLAGPLASARLYNGNGGTAAPSSHSTEDARRTPPHSSRGLNASQQDSRKQLHIFMPSLPKKGLLLAGPASSNEDALSASLNDLYF